mmetsp:Transcript_19326/g.48107  ORF Transcript_19326/g.48107 Transcript_19326/m.48107 type:complete len:272 (+) Transcript_19326:1058-1873(+)
MGIARRNTPRTVVLCLVLLLWIASCSCFCAAEVATHDRDEFDEDELVQETIAAGRGERDEQGIRDQWLSDEHIGSKIDTRRPISPEVSRLLEAYRLTCEGCDHKQAVKKVNAYVKETKRIAKEEKVAQERRDALARKLFGALVVAALSAAYLYREKLGLEFLLQNGNAMPSEGMGEAQAANIRRLRRQQAADAAATRQQSLEAPTWLQNEQKEMWTPKQEKQFQKALREFSGVPKKERYKLIAEKVNGKSRIECLTHHRMLELLAKRKEQQ